MPADILIVDDNYDPQVGITEWITRVGKTGNNSVPIAGRRHTDFVATFKEKLKERNGEPFQGTILDIMFKQDVRGGIAFWETLIAEGLVENAGLLMVSTNENFSDDIDEFGKKHADGRTYYDKLHGERSMQHLCRFLSLIPGAVQCDPP